MTILKLPRKNLISMDRKSITVSIPEIKGKRKKKIDFEIIKKAKGIWKNKNVNGVKYQKQLRAEWD